VVEEVYLVHFINAERRDLLELAEFLEIHLLATQVSFVIAHKHSLCFLLRLFIWPPDDLVEEVCRTL
jgi:hypothetical protein